jgi:RpiR family carbohydrate utilization transcriptional regulator
VSEPTVTRLCRTLGCSGLKELRLQLAGAVYSGVPYLSDLSPADDDVIAVKRKVLFGFTSSVDAVDRALDGASLGAAVMTLATARSVVFIGMGPGSSTVVTDAPPRFSRLGIYANAYSDPHQQRIAAAILGREDVLVAVSNNGRSAEVVAAVRLARDGKARTIAITAPSSPLARAADIAITIPVVEDTNQYFPSYSRIPHLMIVDIIATAVALKRSEQAIANAKRIRLALRDNIRK